MARFNFVKDPNARLDWVYDWSDWLAEDEVIVTSTMIVADGITLESDSHSDTKVAIWLSGGTTGKVYRVTNRILTSDDRTDDRSISVRITER